MKKIKEWLNAGGSYQQGVALFVEFSDDDRKKTLFTAEHQTDYKTRLLKTEMLALAKQLAAASHRADAAAQAVAAETAPALDGHKVDPPQVKESTPPAAAAPASGKIPGRWSHPARRDEFETILFDTWHPLYLEMTHHMDTVGAVAREGLTNPEKKAEACIKAHRVLQLSKQCRQLYRQRDHYFTTGGKAPVASLDEYATDPAKALLKLRNAERYARTMQARLKDFPGDVTALQLLEKHQAAITFYKNLLNIS